MRTAKEVRRTLHGPGGRNCPCCATWARKTSREQENRYVRRKLREELRAKV